MVLRPEAAGLRPYQPVEGHPRERCPGAFHVYVALRGGTTLGKDGIGKSTVTPEQGRAEGTAALHSFLYCGVTTVFDAGNVPDFIFALRDAERAGKLLAPRIFAAGGIVTAPGSHGSGYGSTDIESWPGAKVALDAHFARKPGLRQEAGIRHVMFLRLEKLSPPVRSGRASERFRQPRREPPP